MKIDVSPSNGRMMPSGPVALSIRVVCHPRPRPLPPRRRRRGPCPSEDPSVLRWAPECWRWLSGCVTAGLLSPIRGRDEPATAWGGGTAGPFGAAGSFFLADLSGAADAPAGLRVRVILGPSELFAVLEFAWADSAESDAPTLRVRFTTGALAACLFSCSTCVSVDVVASAVPLTRRLRRAIGLPHEPRQSTLSS